MSDSLAELEEWNARLPKCEQNRPVHPRPGAEADARRSVRRIVFGSARHSGSGPPFTPSSELKGLYREAAKKVHPDTATDERDRARRERIMKEVNAAYAAGDEDAFRRILADLENSPDTVQGSGVGADLVRVLRQLRQVRNRIAAIEVEIAKMSETDIAKLKAKADQAEREGARSARGYGDNRSRARRCGET